MTERNGGHLHMTQRKWRPLTYDPVQMEHAVLSVGHAVDFYTTTCATTLFILSLMSLMPPLSRCNKPKRRGLVAADDSSTGKHMPRRLIQDDSSHAKMHEHTHMHTRAQSGMGLCCSTEWDGVAAVTEAEWDGVVAVNEAEWDGVVAVNEAEWDGVVAVNEAEWDVNEAVQSDDNRDDRGRAVTNSGSFFRENLLLLPECGGRCRSCRSCGHFFVFVFCFWGGFHWLTNETKEVPVDQCPDG